MTVEHLQALVSYDIDAVLSVDRLPNGGPAVRKVTTSAGIYLLKPGWREADVALLSELPALASHGVRQPAIIKTTIGNLVGPDGCFLQEFLSGQLELDPTDTQVLAAMRAVGELHIALRRLQLSTGYEPDQDSVFVQVTDPEFLIRELPGLLGRYEMATSSAKSALAYLAEHQASLETLPRQLVHGDIGPDNVLLDSDQGDQVAAIIDFTPHVLPVLFASVEAITALAHPA